LEGKKKRAGNAKKKEEVGKPDEDANIKSEREGKSGFCFQIWVIFSRTKGNCCRRCRKKKRADMVSQKKKKKKEKKNRTHVRPRGCDLSREQPFAANVISLLYMSQCERKRSPTTRDYTREKKRHDSLERKGTTISQEGSSWVPKRTPQRFCKNKREGWSSIREGNGDGGKTRRRQGKKEEKTPVNSD